MKKSLSLKRLDSLVGNQKECWEWQWSRAGRGLLYGSALWNGKQTTAHRVAYQYWVGNIPKDMTVDHICRNTLCVNPQHLQILSRADNTMAGTCPPAINARKTECKRGHTFDGVHTNGGRYCKTCQKVHRANYSARQKEGVSNG